MGAALELGTGPLTAEGDVATRHVDIARRDFAAEMRRRESV